MHLERSTMAYQNEPSEIPSVRSSEWMPRHDYLCQVCGAVFELVQPWDQHRTLCRCGGAADRVYRLSQHVIDDTLPGGPRWMHNLGDTPIWVETKTELRQIMTERGLVPAERATYNKQDQTPWATKHRLRPGERDPFIHRGDFNR